ncbi:unnamed protein product [Nippostrongylus brasiliensis]|uniref:Glycosyltransferase family 92 protein n=1 Tax=Nippostrongylus brasiliensis TaxID=27835 RepID=A0A0N4XWI8_NIPBR|nr:unnamed protein product [Nippostrongylus brasiliensis]
MDPYSRRVLDHYVSTGEAEAIFFAQQPQYEYYMQYTAIQDCILRNRYHSSYLIMSDLDERMVTGNANDTLVNLVLHYRYPFLGAFSTSTWPIIEMSGTFQTIKYPEHLMGQLFQNVQRRLDRVYKEDLVITTRQPNKT